MKNSQQNTNRKVDRRTLYTRKVVMDAYIQLLKEMPREKIRVAEICRIAEINRCTFYLHFKDIYDVEIAIEEELADKFRTYLKTQTGEEKKRQNLSNEFVDTMLHDDTYVTMMSSGNQSTPLTALIGEFFLDGMKTSLPKKHNLTERQQELLYSFIVGGVMAVEQNWIKTKCTKVKQENMFLDKMVHLLMSDLSSSI